VVSVGEDKLRVGDRVKVLWGFDEISGTITDIWGSPPAQVRVAIELEEGEQPEVLLLSPKAVRKAS
jgi:hypothetical protein